MKEIKGYENYIIYENGDVFSKKSGIFLKKYIGKNGYPRVVLCKNGKTKNFSIHCLLLENFISPRPPGMQAAHLDGNRLNHEISNLSWVTVSENAKHRKIHGTSLEGERHPLSKLSDNEIVSIRQEFVKFGKKGSNARELSEKYKISLGQVYMIVNGQARLSAGGKKRTPIKRLDKKDVETVRSMRSSGYYLKDISKKFGVSISQICHICTGRSWNES